jgi:glucose/arabinose dehydrogenase
MTVAVSDLPFARSGDLLVGALRGERIWRLRTDGDEIVRGSSLLTGHLGRVRTVVDVGDGGLYVLTDNATRGLGPFDGDALLRLTPR